MPGLGLTGIAALTLAIIAFATAIAAQTAPSNPARAL
jgi:multisubunit Na+/H+ antiporter MnhB subunit